jgi:tetratricopeptide (TPR) repeat protein
MGLLLGLLLTFTAHHLNAQTGLMRSKSDNTMLRSGCAGDAPLLASLPAGTVLKLRYALSGESVPCYKVAVDMGGRQIDGYLPASAIEGLDSFDKGRKDAAWVSTTEALNAVRDMPSLDALKAPGGVKATLPASVKVILAQAEQLIEANQPAKAMSILEPEIQKRRDPALLSMAGVAAWRADEAKRALEYWRESLDLAPNPDLDKLYKRVEKERSNDQSGEKLYGVRVVLRYDAGTVPVDTARGMVAAVDSAFARVSAQLGCSAEEKIVTIIQSRDAYKKATDAAEWSGGQYDGRIRVPVMSGQQMDARQEQVLAHETTHACLAMLGEWPSWLHEGMAQRLSGETLGPQMRGQLAEMAKGGKLPKLEALRSGWSGLDAQHARLAYALALEAVDALYENFGNDGVRNLMRNPERLAVISAELDKRLGL